ncbi:MAG: carboxylesterase/lipase family protein [Acidimicrobiia bacterium]
MRDPVVETAYGKVVGTRAGDVHVFRGIPYGSCTGPGARFRRASAPTPWTGERPAVDFGATAPQVRMDLSNVMPAEFRDLGFGRADSPDQDEECLVLNVWTRGLDDARRPVMVWLHGAPWNSGVGSGHDGAPLAASGDVVVVTLNHRLGVLGFLHLDGVAPGEYPNSGVVGMLDVVTALEWVRDHIAAFGGDPGNVMVFGESGGGMKTTTLLAMPDATGLFHKAAIESGPYLRGVPAERASRYTEQFLAELELSPADVAQLDALPVERLIEAQERALRTVEARAVGAGGLPQADPRRFVVGVANGGTLWELGPVVGGAALPHHPFDPVAPACSVDVPLIIGNNKDEASIWLMLYPGIDGATMTDFEEIAGAIHGDAAAPVVDLYRRTRAEAPVIELIDGVVSTDTMWIDLAHIAERKAAGGAAPVYMYLFTFDSGILDGRFRAAHGAEIPYVFDSVTQSAMTGSRPERLDLARAMSTAWVSFARTGDPNHDGIPTWRPYSREHRERMVFDVDIRMKPEAVVFREGMEALGLEFAHPIDG